MPNNKTCIRFASMLLLWQYVQRIQVINIEVNTGALTLICECSTEDLALLPEYKGDVIEDSSPGR